MGLYEHLSNHDFLDLERSIAIRAMGVEAKQLHDEGYDVDADRVLEELFERLQRR